LNSSCADHIPNDGTAIFDHLAVQSTIFVGFFIRLEHAKQHNAVLITYSKPVLGKAHTITAVVRGRIKDNVWVDQEWIWKADDNPFVDQPSAIKGVWTYGHLNPQGFAIDPRDGAIFSTEHGPRGGDELNLIRAK